MEPTKNTTRIVDMGREDRDPELCAVFTGDNQIAKGMSDAMKMVCSIGMFNMGVSLGAERMPQNLPNEIQRVLIQLEVANQVARLLHDSYSCHRTAGQGDHLEEPYPVLRLAPGTLPGDPH